MVFEKFSDVAFYSDMYIRNIHTAHLVLLPPDKAGLLRIPVHSEYAGSTGLTTHQPSAHFFSV